MRIDRIMKEFTINKFLTLKLEKDKTNIYVSGRLFDQCKFIMLNIPIKRYDEIKSIDEASDNLGWTYEGQEGVEYEIDPESEFWGHCSNLQAWYENDYDTRLLHRNLSFSLLRKLADGGDPLAKRVFKEEVAKRFESGYPTVINFILEEGLLDFLNGEEREQLIERSFPIIDKLLDEDKKDDIFNLLFEVARKKKWLEQHFLVFLKINVNISQTLKYEIFIDLLKVAIETGLVNKHFNAMLDANGKLDSIKKYLAFYHFVKSIKSPELFQKNYNRIKTQLLAFLKDIDDLNDEYKNNAFFDLFEVAKITGLLKENFPAFLKIIDKLPSDEQSMAFWELNRLAETFGWTKKYFLVFLETIDKLHIVHKYYAYYSLVLSFNSTDSLQKYYSLCETRFLTLVESIDKVPDMDKYYDFFYLLIIAKKTGLMKKYYSVLLEIFPKLPPIEELQNYYKRDAYPILFKAVKGTILESTTVFKEWKERNRIF